jgi:hypothetical protein
MIARRRNRSPILDAQRRHLPHPLFEAVAMVSDPVGATHKTSGQSPWTWFLPVLLRDLDHILTTPKSSPRTESTHTTSQTLAVRLRNRGQEVTGGRRCRRRACVGGPVDLNASAGVRGGDIGPDRRAGPAAPVRRLGHENPCTARVSGGAGDRDPTGMASLEGQRDTFTLERENGR